MGSSPTKDSGVPPWGRPAHARSIPPGAYFERPDLVARVTDSIRQKILDGLHPPGSPLPGQGKLAAQYNVSVNVVREALRNLRSLGMIQVSQGRLPQVRGMNTEASINAMLAMLYHAKGSLCHLMETRVPLEVRTATLAAERCTPEDVSKCAGIIDEMETTRSPSALGRYDQAFHRGLATAARNPLLLVMVDTLSGLQCNLMQEAHVLPVVTENSIEGHRRILKAVQDHDRGAAAQAMLEHLEVVRRILPSGQDPAAPLVLSLNQHLSGRSEGGPISPAGTARADPSDPPQSV